MKYFASILALALTLSGITSPAEARETLQKVKTFAVAKGGTLDVSVGGGDLRITTWEKDEVVVSAEEPDYDLGSELNVSQQGNTVRITDGGGWSDVGMISVSIPRQFHLTLETAYGDILIKGKLTGNITAETSAGDIRLDEVEGTVDVRTSGGDIQTGKIAGKASLTTSGGDVNVASSTNELEIRSSGGDIRVGNVGKSLQAKTAGGDITIGDVGGEAVASTAGGNVRIGKVSGQATLATSGGDIDLNGGNGVIRASTSGGNIQLTNISGSVEAKTSGGDIIAELVPSGKGKSRLTSAAGMITLSIPENAKATITARIRVRGWRRTQHDSHVIRSDFKEESSLRSRDDQEIESKYVLNGGGETITLETVNSDIEIRKLRK